MRNSLVLWAFAGAFALCSTDSISAISRRGPSKKGVQGTKAPHWRLSSFLKLSVDNPGALLTNAESLLEEDRVRISTVEPSRAYEWQHRLAMVSALSDFFDPTPRPGVKRGSKINGQMKNRARELISQTLLEDPSLLVRDGAVESIRRIVRMQPGERELWKKPLEKAFLSSKNILQGEGFFIRETILTAMRDASLRPSALVTRAAKADKNESVKQLLRAWNTKAYDEI